MERYPYFLYPAISELKGATDPDHIARLTELIAANVGEYDVLAALLGSPEADIAEFYSENISSQATRESSIDSFIAKFGGASILNSDILTLREDSEPELKPEPELEAVAEAEPEPELEPETEFEPVVEPEPETESEPDTEMPEVETADPEANLQMDDDILREVKILIKNRDYNQALAIMEDFYLNNPKKSVYFADQIRFIRKMVLNERKK